MPSGMIQPPDQWLRESNGPSTCPELVGNAAQNQTVRARDRDPWGAPSMTQCSVAGCASSVAAAPSMPCASSVTRGIVLAHEPIVAAMGTDKGEAELTAARPCLPAWIGRTES